MSIIKVGDTVKLGPSAKEKQHVTQVWTDGTVTVRQASTGVIRNVQQSRCIVWFRKGVIENGRTVEQRAPFDTCPDCGDFLAWCPEHPEFHSARKD